MSERISTPAAHDSPAALVSRELGPAALLTLMTVAAMLAIYYQTTASMVSIWERSDTFAHCFLIAPVSAWLIWRQRARLMQLSPRPNPKALAILVVLGFGWLLATLANVLVFQQYFVVAMIPIAVWAILGNRIASLLAFPLAYLLLAVPFGEVFIPAMIDFTADFTVAALQLTGIPVYREGTYFSLASGNWSVVEACSGLRYLIASFTLGTLYAYLNYRSLKLRLAFIALSLVVPIVANGLRAYIIVMMGHLSGMRLAVGADHLIYGWLFFGLVMFLLFWVGSFWHDNEAVKNKGTSNIGSNPRGSASLKASAGVAIAVITVALMGPAYIGYLERHADSVESVKIDIPGVPGKWEASSGQLLNWKPEYIGTPIRFAQTYQNGSRSVSIHVAEYRHQRLGSQLITSGNVLVAEDDIWHNVGQQSRSIDLGSQQVTVTQNRLHSPSGKLLIWRWYRLAAEETSSPYMAKIVLAKHKLLDKGEDGKEVIIAARYEDKPEEAVPVLQAFLNDMMPLIRKGLDHAPVH